MDKHAIKSRLEVFPYDCRKYWVAAGAAMVLWEIREYTSDIDLGCTEELADILERDGLLFRRTEDGNRWFRYGEDIEIFENWISGTVTDVDGIPVVSLEGLIEMKRQLGREKDLRDIELILEHLKTNNCRKTGETQMIRVITDRDQKTDISRAVLEALPDWFAIKESREKYIAESAEEVMVASFDGDLPNGFLCLKETGKDTVEIAVMGVLKEYHRTGIGRAMFLEAKRIAAEKGYSFMQVKTVKMGCYEDYDRTNLFYRDLGFREFEVIPTLWDERNPCQIYIMSLK